MLLSARMLRHGHPFGPVFRAAGGRAVTVREASPLALTCPAGATPGATVAIWGTLRIPGAHTLTLRIGPGTARLVNTDSHGAFTLTTVAAVTGPLPISASFAGRGLHAPSGAECSTDVEAVQPALPPLPAGVNAAPGPPPPAPPSPPQPVATELKLTCPSPGLFTGSLGPAVGGADIAISYSYEIPASGMKETKLDHVETVADGSFQDEPGLPMGAVGRASASFAGGGGYLASSSAACSF